MTQIDLENKIPDIGGLVKKKIIMPKLLNRKDNTWYFWFSY